MGEPPQKWGAQVSGLGGWGPWEDAVARALDERSRGNPPPASSSGLGLGEAGVRGWPGWWGACAPGYPAWTGRGQRRELQGRRGGDCSRVGDTSARGVSRDWRQFQGPRLGRACAVLSGLEPRGGAPGSQMGVWRVEGPRARPGPVQRHPALPRGGTASPRDGSGGPLSDLGPGSLRCREHVPQARKAAQGQGARPPRHWHLQPRLRQRGSSGGLACLPAARSPALPWMPAGLPSDGVGTPWLSPQDEKGRIEALGGFVSHMDCWRVNGTLAVSRAIGKEARGWEGAWHGRVTCGGARVNPGHTCRRLSSLPPSYITAVSVTLRQSLRRAQGRPLAQPGRAEGDPGAVCKGGWPPYVF